MSLIPATVVFRGGSVLTLSEDAVETDALAVRDGVVQALGDDALAAIGPQTRVIDLADRVLMPGINDAHLHGAWLGARWPNLFFGGDHEDQAAEGLLVHDETERRRALVDAWQLLARLGITSYTEPAIGPGEDHGETGVFGNDMLDTYVALHREGHQTARVTMLRLFGILDGPSSLDAFRTGLSQPIPATDPRWLSVTGVKIFADGIPPLRTAWVGEPYSDGTSGHLLTEGDDGPVEAYRSMIRLAVEAGHQVAVHATGDRAIGEFLDELARLDAADATPPHYVIHGDLVTAEQLLRLRELGVGLAIQPLIAALTRDWTGGVLGTQRASHAWPLSQMLHGGVLTTLTSDAPIASPDWRRTLDAAISMLIAVGHADDSALRTLLLHTITTAPARQDGAAHWKGTLLPGMAADLVVLSHDPRRPGRPVADVEIELTMVDGRVVYSREPALEAT